MPTLHSLIEYRFVAPGYAATDVVWKTYRRFVEEDRAGRLSIGGEVVESEKLDWGAIDLSFAAMLDQTLAWMEAVERECVARGHPAEFALPNPDPMAAAPYVTTCHAREGGQRQCSWRAAHVRDKTRTAERTMLIRIAIPVAP